MTLYIDERAHKARAVANVARMAKKAIRVEVEGLRVYATPTRRNIVVTVVSGDLPRPVGVLIPRGADAETAVKAVLERLP